jgi:hypothetical protein
MLTCPMCKKRLPGVEKKCANCKTDVSLLVDYVENLRDGLQRAEHLTRQGELGDAVWEYLEVLEVDPDNATARKQVGKVATAVRQFDQTAPGRRWQKKLQRQTAFRRWMANWNSDGEGGGWLSGLFWFVIVLCALIFGYFIGQYVANHPTPPVTTSNATAVENPEKGK